MYLAVAQTGIDEARCAPMSDNDSVRESAADKAIREALEAVERREKAREEEEGIMDPEEALLAEAASVEMLPVGDDLPPSGDPSSMSATTPPAPAEPPKKLTADQAMIASLLKAKQEMQEALGQTQREAKDAHDRLMRVSADFENFKKRVTREKDDAVKFGNEKVFKEILPVVDNLRRAMAAVPEGADATFVDGVKLVSKQLEDTLGRLGVTGFDSLGEPFDPAKHEAVGSRPDDAVPSQHVCEEYQRGFMLHERLLRPALVIVSAGPAA